MTTQHWNPELVAKLEAERAQGLPRWQFEADKPEDFETRRKMLREVARRKGENA